MQTALIVPAVLEGERRAPTAARETGQKNTLSLNAKGNHSFPSLRAAHAALLGGNELHHVGVSHGQPRSAPVRCGQSLYGIFAGLTIISPHSVASVFPMKAPEDASESGTRAGTIGALFKASKDREAFFIAGFHCPGGERFGALWETG